jgi:hypothetical protein
MEAPILVSKEVAEALDRLKGKYSNDDILTAHSQYGKWEGPNSAVNDLSLMDMAKALLVGYIVEKTAIEHIQEYYNAPSTSLSERTAVRIVLNNLGTKIEGVNA